MLGTALPEARAMPNTQFPSPLSLSPTTLGEQIDCFLPS